MRIAWFRSAFLSLTAAGVLCAQTGSGPAQTSPAAILTHLDATSAQIRYHDRNDHAFVLDFVLTSTTQKGNVKEQDTVCVSYIDSGPDHVAQSIEIYPAPGHSGHHAIPGGVGGVSMLTEPPAYSREGAEARELAEAREGAEHDRNAAKANMGTMANAGSKDSVSQKSTAVRSSRPPTVNTLDNYRQVADVSLTFGFEKWSLTKNDKLALDDFAKQLENANGYFLEVTGGTDATGSEKYDYDLSNRRANAVVEYLASKHGITPHRFVLTGVGKNMETAPNTTSEGRQQNRRVEIRLMVKASATSAEVPPG